VHRFYLHPALADMPAPLMTTTFLLDRKSSLTRIVSTGTGTRMRLCCCPNCLRLGSRSGAGESEPSIMIGRSVYS